MRKHLHRDLRGKLIGELAKDFSRRPLEDIASLIADVTHNGRVVYDGFLLRSGWPHPRSSAARRLAGSLSALTEAFVEKHKLGVPVAHGANDSALRPKASAKGSARSESP